MRRAIYSHDYIIVYNGEIFNTDEIAPVLERRGYAFEIAGDTEVILYVYMEYGTACAEMFNCIWDGRAQRLVLCRACMGAKPLVYALKDGQLIFASEIKALFCHPELNPCADDDSFREIFAIGPARTPGNGVFKGVRELRHGYLGIFCR